MSDKRTASEKIEDIERAVMSIFQTNNNFARDIMIIKDALQLLGNKVSSMAEASVAGEPLTDEVISKYMVERNVETLRNKVQGLVDQGVLVPTDVIGDNTFVVGTETESDGKIVFPRKQFAFSLIEKDVQNALRGKKVGEIVKFAEDKLLMVIKEIYSIVVPKVPEAPAAPAAPVAAESENSAPVETFAPPAAAPAADATPSPAPAEQSSSSADASAPAAPAAAPAADQSGQGSGN
jgi:hypothetical protein